MSRMSIFALTAAAVLSISARVPAAAAPHLTRSAGWTKFSSAAFAGPSQSVARPGSWVMLNPQPLPPGSKAMLNPQPLPPGSRFMLNPQPLPPRALRGGAAMFE